MNACRTNAKLQPHKGDKLPQKVAYHETRLASARQSLWHITKRLKTIQDGQEPDTPQASPIVDIEMEIID